MRYTITNLFAATVSIVILGGAVHAASADQGGASDEIISGQRQMLATSTQGAGFGPQSPRDIDSAAGENNRSFEAAPAYAKMNLCDIHFHENAEHKGGEFTTYAGNGDGHGYGTGFKFDGQLSEAEMADVGEDIGKTENGSLVPGDTIEVHYVYTTAKVVPGPTLDSCFSEAIMNPQLRVEMQVYVLVNDPDALDFGDLTRIEVVDGLSQVTGIPSDTGTPVQYAGSTTGPDYNEKGSPLQVSWSVRPLVAKVNILTVGIWLEGNVFEEDQAHGVRNLVKNPSLLSSISK
ncbi:MAG: delta-class carbonic anhydrase [Paracoccaceae bacterium]